MTNERQPADALRPPDHPATSGPTPDPAVEPAAPGVGSSSTSEVDQGGAVSDASRAGNVNATEAAMSAEGASGTEVADAPTTAEAAATVEAKAAEGPAVATRSRRRARFVTVMRAFLTLVLGVALFAGGVAIGVYAFEALRPAPPAAVGDGLSAGSVPSVANEFISALAANDADAVRSALDKEPHLDLTREMDKFGIQRIDKIEILGTQVDGGRSATEILMQYKNEEGIQFAINLVILVDGGKIEGFR